MEKTPEIFVTNRSEMLANRRQLRSHGTPAEGALWKRLQRRQVGGWLFHRQFSVGHYVLDFYCPALRLGIELDGDYHHHLTQPQADYDREQELWTKHQIRLLRFENQLVFTRPQDIEAAILHFASEHGEGHNSSPKVGEVARSDGGV